MLKDDPEMQELLSLPGEGTASAPAPGEVLPPGAGQALAVVGGAYEAASRFDRELALWQPSYGSADGDLLPEKHELDVRARDLVRNDAYIRSGVTIRKDNIVGSMFTLNSKPEYRMLGLDETWAEEFQQEVEAKFTLWAESPRNWVDASEANNFTSLVRLAVGMELFTGEILATCEWITDDPNRPFQTAIQMVDPDRLSNPTTLVDNYRLRNGVLKNDRGAALGYYIRRSHPTDVNTLEQQTWQYVPKKTPWGRQLVIHIYEQFRPDQSRGVAAMVAALKECRITKQFRDIMLQNAVVNATYAASIESDLPTAEVFAQLGGGTKGGDDIGALVSKYGAGYLGAIAAYQANAKNNKLNGVRIPHLFPGTKLQLRPAGQGGPLGTEFEASLLRYIAANLDISYEQLSRDYSKTNYSSLKGALNETEKGMLARKKLTADTFATHTYHLWLEEAIATRQITSLPRRAPNFWEGMNREAYGACEWIGSSKGQIDELKETQAAALRVKMGLSTWERELARLGLDWRKVFAQQEREQKEITRRKLPFGTVQDNSLNAASGSPREASEAQ